MEHVTKTEFKDAMKRIDKRFDAVDARFGAVDRRFEKVEREIGAVRTELKAEIADLRSSTDRRFDELAAMIARGFEEIVKRLDVRDRVEQLETKMKKVEEALHVSL